MYIDHIMKSIKGEKMAQDKHNFEVEVMLTKRGMGHG